MSQPITREMWKDIEAEMSGYFFDIRFLYKGHEIAVTRVHESESKTSLQVYIDGVIKGAWANEGYAHRPVIIPEVWKLVRKSVFSPTQRKKLIKDLGKRKAKEWFPNLEEVVEFHVPNFSKASVLCRQYKKLEGIELKRAEYGDWDVKPSIPKRKYCVGHAKGLETLAQKMSDALEGTTEHQDLIDEFHRFQIRWIE